MAMVGPIKEITPFEVRLLEVDYSYDVRPPRSAKLVAHVSWGWAPGHDRAER
jgi:hypothetical protein